MIDCGSRVFFIGYMHLDEEYQHRHALLDDLPVELLQSNRVYCFIVQVLVVYPTYTAGFKKCLGF